MRQERCSIQNPKLPHSAGLARMAALFIVLTFGFQCLSATERVFKLGVLAHQGKEKCILEWQPTADYLSEALLQYDFDLVPLGFDEVKTAVAAKKIDFLIANPGIFAEMELEHKLEPIATQLNNINGDNYSSFSSVIFTRADNPDIRSLQDIRGKSVMAVAPNSFGGWLMALREMRSRGLDIPKDLQRLSFSGTHDGVIESVRNRLADVGVTRSGLLEEQMAKNKLFHGEFLVLNLQGWDAEYPIMHSTEMYPFWPLAKLPHITPHVAQRVSELLISLSADDPVLVAAGISGWTIPRNYNIVHSCLKDLRIGPYKKYSFYSIRELILLYGWVYAIILLLITGLLFTIWHRRSLYRRLLVNNHTILEQKEEFQELYEENRILTENLSVGIAFIDKDLKLLVTNPQLREWFPGLSHEDVEHCYQVLNTNGIAEVCESCHVKQSIADGKKHQVIRELRRGDQLMYFNVSAVPVIGKDGIVSSVLEIFEDITSLKEYEKELLQAKLIAEEANQAKSELLANVSHEVRTPLNCVMGFIDLLMDTQLNFIQSQYLDNASNCAQNMLRILNDILDYSKIEAGRLDLDLVKTDMVNLIEQTVDVVKFSAAKKQLEFLVNIPPDMPRFAWVDPLRLKQILINLLSNAIKFTQKGEVELKVSYKYLTERRACFTFQVRDTGIGISQEQQAKLFRPFTQAESSTSREYGGTGLGLSISRFIAQKMGTDIQLKSEKGEGSIFSIAINTDFEKGVNLSYTHLKGRKILFIDDNPSKLEIMGNTLKYWGMEYYPVISAPEALETLQKVGTFDVIIVDYHLEGLKDISLISEMRKIIESKGEPMPAFILNTSTEDRLSQEALKDMGLRYRLVKPVKFTELYLYLREVMEGVEEEMDNVLVSKPQEEASDTKQYWQGKKILVADDNPMNQILFEEIMKKELPAIKLIKAENGLEAVSLATTQKPDLVLMDLQMPKLNGLEATKRIREWEAENPQRGRMPVIALTAGIIAHERQNYLQAGMDYFLTKPLSVGALMLVLKKYLPEEAELPALEPDTEKEKGECINCEHFECGKLFARIFKDRVLLIELIELAKSQLAENFEALERAVAEHNLKKIQYFSHAIRGIALNMNLPILVQNMQYMEQNLDVETDVLQGNLQTVLNEYEIIKTIWSNLT